MKQLFLSLVVGCIAAATLQAQNAANFWANATANEIPAALRSAQPFQLEHQRDLRLDLGALKTALRNAPMEATAAAKSNPVLLTMPMADGSDEVFEIYESPVLAPALAARYPMIKSFAGRGLNDRYSTIRFDYGTEGFHAIIRSANRGEAYIVPAAVGQEIFYTAYFSRDHKLEADRLLQLSCGNEFDGATANLHETGISKSAERSPETILDLRTYRIALSCTGEFASLHGGTKAGVVSAFNTIINLCNSVWQSEVAMKMLIVSSDNLIFLTGATDPYTTPNQGKLLVNQNLNIYPNLINAADYDTGFLLTGCCTDVGGVGPFGSFCAAPNKMCGVACQCQAITDNFYINTLVHEIGHKMTAHHTMNNCAQYSDQVDSPNAYEPGSGSTIMSYAGACGVDNIQQDAVEYYHVNNLEQIIDFTRTEGGSLCNGTVAVNNNIPVATIPLQNNFYIPISTPFQLTGSATDADNDALTYCWEQYDLGASAALNAPGMTSPLFRSFPPTSSSTRVFPRLLSILNNSTSPVEQLPANSRDLNFRMTVRDNNPTAGAAVWAQIKFKATATAGPFRVVYPNSDVDTLTAGNYEEIKWDVANSDNNLVKCKKVNIKLSIDGGFNYPITLVANTDNDGSQVVLIPTNAVTVGARVRVEAADNIFFDLSNKNFTIQAAPDTSFSTAIYPDNQRACLPTNIVYELKSAVTLGFSENITFSVLSGLPAGVTAAFASNPTPAGQDAAMTLTIPNGTAEGNYNVTVRGSSASGKTADRTIKIRVVSNNFSTLATTAPADGAAGISTLPSFTWAGATDADKYRFQLATNPSFATTLVDTTITGTSYNSTIILIESTIYYYRVLGINECQASDFTETKSFETVSLSCSTFSNSTPINIPASGTPTVESTINIPTGGTLSDVNVSKFEGNHDFFKDLDVRLISPVDTSVLLFKSVCGTTGNFSIGIDDQSPNAINCPPTNGKIWKPVEQLAKFNGQNAQGTWKLRIKDQVGTSGGQLTKWELKICSSVSLSGPFVVKNDTLPVAPGKSRLVDNNYLFINDNNNTAAQLTFTIVRLPKYGTLSLNGVAVAVGNQFKQSDVNSGAVKYKHNIANTQPFDNFTFTISDGEGGFIGTPQFNFKLDPTAPDAVSDVIDQNALLVYPNPADQKLHIELIEPTSGAVSLTVFNVQGQVVSEQKYATADPIQLQTSGWASGIYVIKLRTKDKIAVRKVNIQH